MANKTGIIINNALNFNIILNFDNKIFILYIITKLILIIAIISFINNFEFIILVYISNIVGKNILNKVYIIFTINI